MTVTARGQTERGCELKDKAVSQKAAYIERLLSHTFTYIVVCVCVHLSQTLLQLLQLEGKPLSRL